MTIQILIEKLQELIDIAQEAIGCMEPYYSQCGVDDELYSKLQEFQSLIPKPPQLELPQLICPTCGKVFQLLGRNTRKEVLNNLLQHGGDKHGWGNFIKQQVELSLSTEA